MINDDGRMHLMSAECKGVYFLRFVCSIRTEPDDVKFAWCVISELTEKLLSSQEDCNKTRACKD